MAIQKVEPNQPLTVSLKYATGIEKQGRYGVQYLYTLENGDALFVPPLAHAEIQALHAGTGEPFTLTKSVGQGNQIVWKVERISKVGGPTIQSNRPATEVSATTDRPKHTTPQNGVKPAVAVMPAAPALTTPQSRAMVKQLFAAVDACKLTQEYARQQGIDFQVTADMICRVAITGGIQVFKEGVY